MIERQDDLAPGCIPNWTTFGLYRGLRRACVSILAKYGSQQQGESMDSNAVVSAIANVIIALTAIAGVVLGIIGLRRDSQQEKRRAEWERDQEQKRLGWEQRKLDADAPHLVPIGAAWNGLNDTLPQRLAGDVNEIEIELRNQGNSTPFAVAAVLFPSRVMNPQSRQRTDNLYGIYWEGKLDVSPAPGERTRLVLRRQNYPINGDQRLIERYTLFAPDEPDLRLPQTDPWCFARLTLSYRDANKRTLGLIYNAQSVMNHGSLTQEWAHVSGPEKADQSLPELIDQTNRNRVQAQNPF
jgi:hypothetical protein